MSDTTQVLTFTLGEDEYCIPIDYVAEIVGGDTVRSVPNTDTHVEGITDLRGETTTIVDPSELLEVDTGELLTDGGEATERIIVLDADALDTDSPVGWLVSEVRAVSEVAGDALDSSSITDSPYLRGFLKDDGNDSFTLWLDPHELIA
ncbi:chemotaxis protein CheW [Halonotius sp. GCM10025705]|uniref:chemotaxis protein CheW n=1 Tax=Halonotius sp. GCM10025705 TaxID=3252678 RepID=UPI003609C6B1